MADSGAAVYATADASAAILAGATVPVFVADGVLPLCAIRKWEFVQRDLSARESDDHISESKTYLLAAVGNLYEGLIRALGPGCEVLPQRRREVCEEGFEVHGAAYCGPVGPQAQALSQSSRSAPVTYSRTPWYTGALK